ncbi:MAG: hypothetical protein RBT65_18455 [Methanolobus sp.]|jgi:hypothetical protein|nr:hypothetical protein [Methanolobus sp.]
MSIITFIAWYMLTGMGYMIGHIVFVVDITGAKYMGSFGTLILNAIIFPINNDRKRIILFHETVRKDTNDDRLV